jgi:hypothetical protein
MIGRLLGMSWSVLLCALIAGLAGAAETRLEIFKLAG